MITVEELLAHVAPSDAQWVRWLLNDVAFGGKAPQEVKG